MRFLTACYAALLSSLLLTMKRPIRSGLAIPLLIAVVACGDTKPANDGSSLPGSEVQAGPGDLNSITFGDDQAIARYRLTDQDMQRWMELYPVQDDFFTRETDLSLDAFVESEPEHLAAVERAGLTPSGYANLLVAVFVAMELVEAERMGMNADSIARAERILPENVNMVKKYDARIRELVGI